MHYIILFFISINLFADNVGFKPLPNWLFFTIIIFLILFKVLIGKLIKNRVKKHAKESQEDETE